MDPSTKVTSAPDGVEDMAQEAPDAGQLVVSAEEPLTAETIDSEGLAPSQVEQNTDALVDCVENGGAVEALEAEALRDMEGKEEAGLGGMEEVHVCGGSVQTPEKT